MFEPGFKVSSGTAERYRTNCGTDLEASPDMHCQTSFALQGAESEAQGPSCVEVHVGITISYQYDAASPKALIISSHILNEVLGLLDTHVCMYIHTYVHRHNMVYCNFVCMYI